jgi:hypothetical protein
MGTLGTHNADLRTVTANIKNNAVQAETFDLGPKRRRRTSSRLAYSLHRLGEMTDVSVKLLYLEIAAGRLVARKIGRRTIVRRPDAIRWLRALPVLNSADQRDIRQHTTVMEAKL